MNESTINNNYAYVYCVCVIKLVKFVFHSNLKIEIEYFIEFIQTNHLKIKHSIQKKKKLI